MLFLVEIFLLLLPLWGRGEIPVGNDVRKELACKECHSDLLEFAVMHYPAEDACDNCHEATGEEHPGENMGFKLMDQSPALCFYCHEEIPQQDHPHQPLVKGSCLDCHDAHGSAETALLKSPEQELCLSCHNLHGSQQIFLMEEQVGFGNWEMNMNFIPEENGGSCQPGCHAKLSYSRQRKWIL